MATREVSFSKDIQTPANAPDINAASSATEAAANEVASPNSEEAIRFTDGQTDDSANGTQPRRRKSSPAKIAANRQNSRKSTGPKTERGKRNSRFNATRHGILAKHVVLPRNEWIENPREFRQLLDALCDEFKPVGVAEMHKVEEYALCMLRAQRAARFESATIRKNFWETTDRVEPEPIIHPRFRNELCKSHKGVQFLTAVLRLGLRDIEEHGQLQPKAAGLLRAYFPYHMILGEKIADEKIAANNTADENRIQIIAAWMKECLEDLVQSDLRKSQRDFEIRVGTALVPKESDLQLLQRYEAANSRRMQRALEDLHRLQERRLKRCQENRGDQQ
jgi:hypothetical protein